MIRRFFRRLFRRQHVLICQQDGRQFTSDDPRRRFCCLSCALDHDREYLRGKTAA